MRLPSKEPVSGTMISPLKLSTTVKPRRSGLSLKAGLQDRVSTSGQKAWTVIEEAAAKQQVPRADVLSSLQQLEKEAQAAGLTGSLADVQGRWRLVFSAPGAIKQLEYLPVPEYVAYDAVDKSIVLTTELGVLLTTFCGTFTWNDSNNTMTFGFESLVIKVFGQTFTFGTKQAHKQWQFYKVQGDIACVRSSSGFWTLLCRRDQ